MFKIRFRTGGRRLLGEYAGYASVETARVHLRRWGYRQPVAGVERWIEPTSGQLASVLVDLSR